MQLTMTGEYAIRTMIHLSALRFGEVVQTSEISAQWGIPNNFLRKITSLLSNGGFLTTSRGVNGGIRLARPAETMTLLDVIEAVEGRVRLNRCLMCEKYCSRESWCQVHTLWSEAQEKMKGILSSKSLAQLAAESLDRRAAIEEGKGILAVEMPA